MYASSENEKQIKNITGITFFLFLILRAIGPFVFDNNWSFTHLLYIPFWYYVVPLFIGSAFLYLNKKQNLFFENLLETKSKQIVLFVLFFVVFFLFQFDSFLYGGGNYKINQIAQVDNIIYRFYEHGTVLLVSLFYKFFTLFNIDNNTAGFFSWKFLSYAGTLLTFIASLLLSEILNKNAKNRFLIFLIIFFGPQTLSYFGFIGNASLISASLFFFIYFGIQFEKNNSFMTLGILWSIALLSIWIHISLLILIPALLFVTYKKLIRQKNIAFFSGIISYVLLTVAVFWVASTNFEYSKYILLLNKQNMHARYNLFSLRHISDFLQLIFLFIPQIIVIKFLFFLKVKDILKTYQFQLLSLLILPAMTLVFILEPTHSVILDAPILAVYFSPLVILLVLLLSQSAPSLRYVALFSLLVPLLTLPSYIKLDIAENQIGNYIEKNQHYYIECATALQDSYFYQKDLDKANVWYISLPKESRDYLDLTAAGEYSVSGMYTEAKQLYYKLKTKAPYWGDPRFQIALILMKQNQFQLARFEIDTCLMIEPYNKDYLKLQYAYYRDLGNFIKAKENVLYALNIFPNDYSILTDLAVTYYRLQDFRNADSVATEVIKKDPSQAYAYLIRGLIAEVYDRPTQAIEFLKEYIKLAPNEPETPNIRKRLNDLIILQQTG